MFKLKTACYDKKGMSPALGYCLTSQLLLLASYEVSLIITKAHHTAGEKLIKPSAVEIAQILLGQNEAKRIDSIPLSDYTVNNRIPNDILSQHIAQIQDSPFGIRLQFDETTDMKSISQLLGCSKNNGRF